MDLNILNVKDASSTLGLETRVCFYGTAYGDEANQLMLASDLCVIPEDVGLSAMHAMSAGLPVVSYNAFERQMPEDEAIEEGKNGSFYVNDSVEDLADKIERLLSSPQRLSTAIFSIASNRLMAGLMPFIRLKKYVKRWRR